MKSGPSKGECERCGKFVGLLNTDYCAHCSKDLCNDCMAKGCCGHFPAESGSLRDYRQDISED
jgi:hypothetical protein